MAERKRNTGRAGSLSLLQALELAGQNFEANKQEGAPFNFGESVRGADKAIQQGVFGVTDFIGREGKRVIDGRFGLNAFSETLPKLIHSGPSNVLDALATTRQGGAKWEYQDLQAQRDRDNLGKAGVGALDATWLLPAVPAAKAGGKIAGDVGNEIKDAMLARSWREYEKVMAQDAARQASGQGIRSMADMPRSGGPSFGRDPTRVARAMSSQEPTTLSMGFGSSGKDGQRSLAQIIGDAMRGKKASSISPELQSQIDLVRNPPPPSAAEPLSMRVYRGIGGEKDSLPPKNVYVTADPEYASKHAIGNYADDFHGEGYPAVMPMDVTLRAPYRTSTALENSMTEMPEINMKGGMRGDAWWEDLRKKGYDSVIDEKGNQIVVFDPQSLANPFPAPRNPLDQFTPPTSIDDIFTGGEPRGPRELTGGPTNPAGLDGSAFNLNTPEVPYDPAKGFGGLDAKFAADKNARTLSEALAKARDPKGPTTLGMGAPFEGKGKGIKAYHGSPHDFDRFDMSKIGTGEGAQAYGHGLYFAENEAVAKQYRDQLARDFFKTEDGLFNPSSLEHLNVRVPASRGELDNAIERARFIVSSPSSPEATRAMAARDLKTLEEIKAKGGIQPHEGHMYEANINADPNSFLDLDQPFYGQSESVQDAIGGLVDKPNEYYDLNTLLQNGVGRFKTPAQTSETLRNAGIPGAKYLDQNSRNAGGWHITPPEQTTSGKWMVKSSDYNSKGLQFDTKAAAEKALAEKLASDTRNYVVFDDKLVDINRKYMGVPADDLIKLLMAYGAFGGMSAGALATHEANKKAPRMAAEGF